MPSEARAKPELCELVGFPGTCLQKQDLVVLIYFAAGFETVRKRLQCQEVKKCSSVCRLQALLFWANGWFSGKSTN